MTQVKMPEPVAWATPDLSKLFGENEMRTLEGLGGSREKQKTVFSVALITTDQAEAYAAAKVREALEQAIAICQAEGDEWDSDSVEIEKNYAHAARDRIRALIPKEQA